MNPSDSTIVETLSVQTKTEIDRDLDNNNIESTDVSTQQSSMEDKPLTESINKQYSKYGSLRSKQDNSRIELCNAEDDGPLKFLTRIDSSIKDAKARVKKSMDNSSISEELLESSFDQDNAILADTIPMVKLERIHSRTSSVAQNTAAARPSSSCASTDHQADHTHRSDPTTSTQDRTSNHNT